MRDRHGVQEAFLGRNWLADYEPVLLSEVKASWGHPSLSILRRLREFTGVEFDRVSPDRAQGFLTDMLKRVTPARRNRALVMCNRFYKWAIRTERAKTNPFAGIRLLREERSGDIAYCSREERDRIVRLARENGESDWLAVPLAFYAGLRRGEAYRADWQDVIAGLSPMLSS